MTRFDFNVKPTVIYCCICPGDSYEPCEHLLKLLEGDEMAEGKDILAPVKINDSPSKSIAHSDQQTKQFREQGATATDAVKNNFNKNPVDPSSLK
jgi:hypothetical protein